ncbi:MAG: hypothetical protein ACE5FG_13880 [Myxococcota bacterium]
MNISDVIGNKVMVLVHSPKGLEKLGIDADSKYCRVVGFDNVGLWIENPSYEETPIRRPDGSLIPPEERRPERYVAHILIPWSNVRGVVYFPERERDKQLESEEVRPIGSYL